MQKPFDVADLVERLKGQGLDIAEEAAKLVVESVLSWVSDSVLATDSKLDDLAVAIIPIVKDIVLKEVDKIDQKVG